MLTVSGTAVNSLDSADVECKIYEGNTALVHPEFESTDDYEEEFSVTQPVSSGAPFIVSFSCVGIGSDLNWIRSDFRMTAIAVQNIVDET